MTGPATQRQVRVGHSSIGGLSAWAQLRYNPSADDDASARLRVDDRTRSALAWLQLGRLWGSCFLLAVEGEALRETQTSYEEDTARASVAVGHPLFAGANYPGLRLWLGYRIGRTDVSVRSSEYGPTSGAFFELYNHVPLRGLFDSGTASSVYAMLRWDSRDSRASPTRGTWASLSVETARDLLASEREFTRYHAGVSGYRSLWGQLFGRLHVEWAWLTTRAPQGLALAEYDFLGGEDDVRGQGHRRIGPVARLPIGYNGPLTPEEFGLPLRVGGNMRAHYNLELEARLLPGLHLIAFQDGGNVWNVGDTGCAQLAYWEGDCNPRRVLWLGWGGAVRARLPTGQLRGQWAMPLGPAAGDGRHQWRADYAYAW